MDNKYINSVDFFKAKQADELVLANDLILAAYELRTPENVGALIRLAGNIGIRKVIFIQSETIFRAKKIARVAHSSIKHVDYIFCKPDEFVNFIPDDYQIVAVETSEEASNIFATSLPSKSVLMVGNERFGIGQECLDKASKTVYIPLLGKTMSMNVSHAATIAAFEWGRQHLGLEKM